MPDGIPKDGQDFIRRLLMINPADRVGLDEEGAWTDYKKLCGDKFFKNMDFSNLMK
jgi:hypothetical protein